MTVTRRTFLKGIGTGAAAVSLAGLGGFRAFGQGNVTINLAGFSGDTNVVQQLLSKFTKNIAGVKEVVWQPVTGDMRAFVLQGLSASTAPDIFYVDSFWTKDVVDTGKMQALDDLISASSVLKKADLLTNLVETFTLNGKLYAISKDFNSLIWFQNIDQFNQAGVDLLTSDDDFNDVLTKLSAVAGKTGKPTVLNPDGARFLPLAFSAGMPLLTEDAKGKKAPFGSTEAKLAAEFYTAPFTQQFQGRKFPKKFGMTSSDVQTGWPGEAFYKEKASCVIEGGWLVPPIRDNNPTENFSSVFPPLASNTGQRGNFLFTVGYGMPSFGPNQALAFKVIEAITSPEAQAFILEAGLALPSRKALLNNPILSTPKDTFQRADKVDFLAAGLPGSVPFRFDPVGGGYLDTINAGLTKIFNGEANVSDAMDAAAAELDKKLVDLGLRKA